MTELEDVLALYEEEIEELYDMSVEYLSYMSIYVMYLVRTDNHKDKVMDIVLKNMENYFYCIGALKQNLICLHKEEDTARNAKLIGTSLIMEDVMSRDKFYERTSYKWNEIFDVAPELYADCNPFKPGYVEISKKKNILNPSHIASITVHCRCANFTHTPYRKHLNWYFSGDFETDRNHALRYYNIIAAMNEFKTNRRDAQTKILKVYQKLSVVIERDHLGATFCNIMNIITENIETIERCANVIIGMASIILKEVPEEGLIEYEKPNGRKYKGPVKWDTKEFDIPISRDWSNNLHEKLLIARLTITHPTAKKDDGFEQFVEDYHKTFCKYFVQE